MGRTLWQQTIIGASTIVFWTVIIFALLYIPDFIGLNRASRSISIYAWTDMIDAETIQEFEQQTGIKVYISYIESNEELLVKLKTTGGAGYDIIMPSDYIVQALIKDKLIKKLDHSRLTIMDRFNPKLMNLYFDPGNQYSLPYHWGVYGIGVDIRYFDNQLPTPSWALLFDHKVNPYKVAMINVAREALLIAAQYKYRSFDNLSEHQLGELKKLLMQQKQMVEVYADSLTEYFLLSQICPVIITTTPFSWRSVKYNKQFHFLFPQEGSFSLLDCLAISASSCKEDFVYQFLNFLYQPEILRRHFERFTFLPATRELPELFQEFEVPESIVQAHQQYDRLNFFRPVIPEDSVNKIWLAVKAF